MVRMATTLILFALALPAAAQTAVGAASTDKPKPEKQVCRRIEETGSIMGGKRICHTKSQWSAIDTANSNAAAASRDMRGQGGGQQGGGGLN